MAFSFLTPLSPYSFSSSLSSFWTLVTDQVCLRTEGSQLTNRLLCLSVFWEVFWEEKQREGAVDEEARNFCSGSRSSFDMRMRFVWLAGWSLWWMRVFPSAILIGPPVSLILDTSFFLSFFQRWLSTFFNSSDTCINQMLCVQFLCFPYWSPWVCVLWMCDRTVDFAILSSSAYVRVAR